MNFKTIWTLPGLPLRERWLRTRDWAAIRVGEKLPVRIRYWVTLRAMADATMKSPNVPATTLDYILDHLEKPKVVR
jgi:hypothetical protein